MLKRFLIFLLAAYFVAGCSMSAKYNNSLKDKRHKFKISEGNEHTKIETLPVASSIRANETLTYYWYKNDNVHTSNGGYDGKLLDGNYAVYFSNDNLKEKGQFVNGLKNGKWIEWYENGKIKSVSLWRNGLKQGVHETYDTDGLLETKSTYRKGKLHGKTTIYVRGVDKDIRLYRDGVEVLPPQEKEKSPEKMKEDKENGDKKKDNSEKQKKEKENKEDKSKEKSKGKSL